ncbi:MAG: HXXEE domain-containing protein [Dokdonella sp.]
MNLVYWLPLICASLHVVEEFFWPGGFSDWFRAYRPENRLSFTRGFAIAANGILLAAGAVLGWLGPDWSRGLSVWLIIAAILGANALLHIVGSWRTRRYSPGLVTSVLLYLPLCIGGYAYFIGSGAASLGMATTSFAIGASYDIWSNLSHRARSAAMKRTMA